MRWFLRLEAHVYKGNEFIDKFLTQPCTFDDVKRRLELYGFRVECAPADRDQNDLPGISSDEMLSRLSDYVEEQQEHWWNK